MKTNSNSNANASKSVPATPKSPAALQWVAYDLKWREFYPNESRRMTTIGNIHAMQSEHLWFAEHTPIPFKTHWPEMDIIASLAVRYLCELARQGNDHAIREAGSIAIEVCELLDELLHGESATVDERAKELRRLAEELPYWPMLHFKHRQAVNHFERLADKLHLGERCWLNADERANYSLQTPVNRLAWRCVRHFQEIHEILGRRFSSDEPEQTIQERLANYVLNDRGQGMIYEHEIPIYEASLRLCKLSKKTARDWVDVAFMPWIKVRWPDLRVLPAFASVDTG